MTESQPPPPGPIDVQLTVESFFGVKRRKQSIGIIVTDPEKENSCIRSLMCVGRRIKVEWSHV
jgi:hypothetical protein